MRLPSSQPSKQSSIESFEPAVESDFEFAFKFAIEFALLWCLAALAEMLNDIRKATSFVTNSIREKREVHCTIMAATGMAQAGAC